MYIFLQLIGYILAFRKGRDMQQYAYNKQWGMQAGMMNLIYVLYAYHQKMYTVRFL